MLFYYFAVWKPTGHPNDDPIMESNMRTNSERLNVCQVFMDRITAVTQTISIIFEGVDQTAYHSYLQVFDRYL